MIDPNFRELTKQTLFNADFGQTALGRKLRQSVKLEDLDEDGEYTMDDQLREEAAVGII